MTLLMWRHHGSTHGYRYVLEGAALLAAKWALWKSHFDIRQVKPFCETTEGMITFVASGETHWEWPFARNGSHKPWGFGGKFTSKRYKWDQTKVWYCRIFGHVKWALLVHSIRNDFKCFLCSKELFQNNNNNNNRNKNYNENLLANWKSNRNYSQISFNVGCSWRKSLPFVWYSYRTRAFNVELASALKRRKPAQCFNLKAESTFHREIAMTCKEGCLESIWPIDI